MGTGERFSTVAIALLLLLGCTGSLCAQPPATTGSPSDAPRHVLPAGPTGPVADVEPAKRPADLIANLTIFVLAIFIGFEIITKVPPTLHTPLMSGSNAISGITIVGALVIAGTGVWGLEPFSGFVAAILAMINVVGGFLVTHRMLAMFQLKK